MRRGWFGSGVAHWRQERISKERKKQDSLVGKNEANRALYPSQGMLRFMRLGWVERTLNGSEKRGIRRSDRRPGRGPGTTPNGRKLALGGRYTREIWSLWRGKRLWETLISHADLIIITLLLLSTVSILYTYLSTLYVSTLLCSMNEKKKRSCVPIEGDTRQDETTVFLCRLCAYRLRGWVINIYRHGISVASCG